MGITYDKHYSGVVGSRRVWRGVAHFDSSYITGGESYTPADFELAVEIDHVNVGSTNLQRYRVTNREDTSKLMLLIQDPTTALEEQEANAADASTVEVHITVTGV